MISKMSEASATLSKTVLKINLFRYYATKDTPWRAAEYLLSSIQTLRQRDVGQHDASQKGHGALRPLSYQAGERRRLPGHPNWVRCPLLCCPLVASRRTPMVPAATPPSWRFWPILSPVFVPIVGPVGDPTPAEPAPCADLSFFFAGQDLWRSFHPRVSPSVSRARVPRSRSSDYYSIAGSSVIVLRWEINTPFFFKRITFWRTSWLWRPRFWCWW